MSDPKASSEQSSTITTVKNVAEVVDETRQTFNEGIHTVARGILHSAAAVDTAAKSSYQGALQALDESKVYVDQGLAYYKRFEDGFFTTLKDGIEWGIANPYVSYPAAGFGALLLFPFTRRGLYWLTLGRFRNEESVFRSAEARVQGLKTKLEDYSKEASKLESRMNTAEEELTRGRTKLKATRLELQRLSSILASSEKAAQKVVTELRSISPAIANSLQVRGEAAAQLAVLRQERAKVDKYVYRIASKDI